MADKLNQIRRTIVGPIKSLILTVLRLLTPLDIQGLALNARRTFGQKRISGDELIWTDESHQITVGDQHTALIPPPDATVIPFPSSLNENPKNQSSPVKSNKFTLSTSDADFVEIFHAMDSEYFLIESGLFASITNINLPLS